MTISGTPTAAGKYTLKLTATNGAGKTNKSYKLVVYGAPEITTTTLSKAATSGKSYSAKLTASGTTPITWALADGSSLPDGLTLTAKTGKISGKPTGFGTKTFTVVATNSYGSDTQEITMTINSVAPKITGSLKKGTAGKAYSATLKGKGTEPLTWTLTGASLPDGITFTDGTFSGTCERYYKGDITVTLANAAGETVQKAYTLEIKAAAPKISTTSLASGTVGTAYSATLAATGTPDITWSWTKNPSGLTLDAETGEISGTPTESGKFSVKITATNDAGSRSKTLKLVIAAAAETGALPDVKSSPESEEPDDEPESPDEPESLNSDEEHYSSAGELPEEFVIVSELGEVSVDMSGMYDFAVTLSDEAPEGAKLFWAADSDSPSEDDEIAEFFDESGQEIDSVPAERKISVSVWFNEGRIYRPVIAVKP